MLGLSSQTRDRTRAACVGRSHSHWTAGEVPFAVLLSLTLECASLVAQTGNNQPAMQETWVQSLGWDDPLEEGMATHSSILAWKTQWTEEPGGQQSMGSQRVRYN